MIESDLLEILRCPKCRGELALVDGGDSGAGLRCAACALIYPILDGIPQLLVEEAQPDRR